MGYTHTSGFHAAWKRDPGTFAFSTDHEYWKLPGNTSGVTTVSGASEGVRLVIQDQQCLDIYEVVSCHQVEAYDASFYSFLSGLSNVLDHSK